MKVLTGAVVILSAMAAGAQGPNMLGGIEVPGFAVQSLDQAKFKSLHAAVAPQGEGERWTEIPWLTDLNAARKLAAREGKPLFLWIMDGHPLGCT